MFGFRKASKLRDIDQRFGQILTVLSSGGNQRASDAISGIRVALQTASDQARSGATDVQIAKALARKAQSDRGQTSGKSLGYLYVALIYEARSIGTKDAFKLASHIQEAAYDVMTRFSNVSGDFEATSTEGPEGTGVEEISDRALETAIKTAKLLQKVLDEMGVYQTPMILMRPSALGYIWGWCDATTQRIGLSDNSAESLGVCMPMFVSFFDSSNFGEESEEGFDLQILSIANDLREKGDENFFKGVDLGGSDLFSYIDDGFSEDIAEHLTDVFTDTYYNEFSR